MAVQASGMEFSWKSVKPEVKEEFKLACKEAWKVWVESDAGEILSKWKVLVFVNDCARQRTWARSSNPDMS